MGERAAVDSKIINNWKPSTWCWSFQNRNLLEVQSEGTSHIESLQAEISKMMFSVKLISGNDSATQFYNRLPNYGAFLTFLMPHVTPSNCLPSEEELFMVVVKLRLNFKLMFRDLSSRFEKAV